MDLSYPNKTAIMILKVKKEGGYTVFLFYFYRYTNVQLGVGGFENLSSIRMNSLTAFPEQQFVS